MLTQWNILLCWSQYIKIDEQRLGSPPSPSFK